MTKEQGRPEDIPEEVWKAASIKALGYVEWLIPAPHDYAGSEHVLTSVIARAILAAKAEEREVCASLVALMAEDSWSQAIYSVASDIAAAIRKRGEG